MVELTLPSYLCDGEGGGSSRRTLALGAGRWAEIVEELRTRYPRLAGRVLNDSGRIADGFVLVVNDEVCPRDCAGVELRDGDEFSIIGAIAGG